MLARNIPEAKDCRILALFILISNNMLHQNIRIENQVLGKMGTTIITTLHG